MIQYILAILVFIIAFPVGFLLAWLCKDELVQGRAWFKILIGISLILSVIVFFVLQGVARLSVILSLIFIVIVSSISLWKSYDKGFARD